MMIVLRNEASDKVFNSEKENKMTTVKLRKVRLSFADLFKPVAFQDGDGPKKFKATFLISKDDPQLKVLKQAIKDVAKEKWKDKADRILKTIEDNPMKYCLADGDKKNYDGYENCMALTANNEKRPKVKDRNGKDNLTEADGRPYSGCYVTGHVELWAQDNKWGQAIRATLRGVQFDSDGDSFAAGAGVAKDDEFDDLGDGADVEDDLA